MPFDQFAWLGRLKAIEREYLAARMALDRVSGQLRADPSLLQGDLRPRDFTHAAERLEGTYIVRLFAEFETALRKFWSSTKKSAVPIRIHDLIQRVASACKIGDAQLTKAQEVREYRNSLVHERDEPLPAIPIAVTRKHLCIFVTRLR